MLKGAVAGTSPTGPWTAEGTGVRTPDDDDCQSMAHTTGPSMPPVSYSVKMIQFQQGLSLKGERNISKSESVTSVWQPEEKGQP